MPKKPPPENATTGYSSPVGVSLDEIDSKLRPASEMRVGLNQEQVENYAANLKEILDKEPVKLMVDEKGKHLVVDGAHTITAARKAGNERVWAIVKTGTYLEAFKEAAACNQEHGVPLTNADKRHRVEVALKHPEMKGWPQEKIAKWCGVHQTFVSKVVGKVPQDSIEVPTVGNDGKTYASPEAIAARRQRVLNYFEQHPQTSDAVAAKELGIPLTTIGNDRRALGLAKKTGSPRSRPAVSNDPQPARDPPSSNGEHTVGTLPFTSVTEPETDEEFNIDDELSEIETLLDQRVNSWSEQDQVSLIVSLHRWVGKHVARLQLTIKGDVKFHV